ncbi:MAG: aminotransferase class IV [Chitinophagaceae bacterium]
MIQNLFCNLNGSVIPESEAPYCSADDSFRLRYGLYESYLFQNVQLEFAHLHWDRLLHGMQVLGFTVPDGFSESYFTKQIDELAAKNKLSDLARIRLQVFTNDDRPPFSPQFLIECSALQREMTEWIEKGIKVAVLENFGKEISAVSNCKISHNKHFLPARKAMGDNQLDDVLLLNEKGNVIESAMANLFWVKDGMIFTPPLSEGCLAGTFRLVIIDLIIELSLPFKERIMSLEDLKTADEVFLTNGIRKIRWVREIDGHFYGNAFAEKLNIALASNISGNF